MRIVFSTCVEVNRRTHPGDRRSRSLLHVRGGQPAGSGSRARNAPSSPRAWRSTWLHPTVGYRSSVFSTCVEVNPRQKLAENLAISLLHVRGGQPSRTWSPSLAPTSSPRAWRSTVLSVFTPEDLRGLLHVRGGQPTRRFLSEQFVFSTCVEVNRRDGFAGLDSGRLLHVRGGQPRQPYRARLPTASSPRAWRSTASPTSWADAELVFSTCVEVNLVLRVASTRSWSLLHVRGGQPVLKNRNGVGRLSSPRAWRSTYGLDESHGYRAVFSTCVEVNPLPDVADKSSGRLLHVRGGQPLKMRTRPPKCRSSPRAWRSTYTASTSGTWAVDFSTCVEVNRAQALYKGSSLLHMRGGQPTGPTLSVFFTCVSPHLLGKRCADGRD